VVGVPRATAASRYYLGIEQLRTTLEAACPKQEVARA
jgi:hypothetical protein